MIDAAELARLRCCPPGACKRAAADRDDTCRRDSLLDALEKAQGERDEALGLLNANEDVAKSAIAQRDSARALLREALPRVFDSEPGHWNLRARIAAELEKA